MISAPPGLILIAGALLLMAVPVRARPAFLMALPVLSAFNLYALGVVDPGWTLTLFDYELVLTKTDKLSMLFGWLFHIGAFIGLLFALHIKDPLQQIAALVYVGGAMGAIAAGDWISFFIYWEVMAWASVFLIWARQSRRALGAAMRYFGIQLISGLLLLSGVLVLIAETGSSEIGYLGLNGLGPILIFVGLGIKGAFPLVHTWLIDAYPESTPTGTVFLSIFSTKTAIYALAVAFPGAWPLIWIGIAMTIFPIFYAVIENDFRRVLAYSTINQLGFMVAGIGLGTALAINGAVAHAFADVIFKGLLFMSMGAVLHVTGRITGTDMGGLYKSMPMTAGLCSIGALAIAGMPLFSAFVTKSMILQAFADEGLWVAWILLLFAAAGVVEHASIKIPFFTFFGHDRGIKAHEPPWNMLAAMSIAAVGCVVIGVWPSLLYRLLPFDVSYHAYSLTHVLTQLQLLVFASLAVFVLMRIGRYPPELRSTNLDFDWIYRRLVLPAVRGFADLLIAASAYTGRGVERPTRGLLSQVFRVHGPEGVFGRTWLIGNTVLWIAALLGLYLIIYYT